MSKKSKYQTGVKSSTELVAERGVDFQQVSDRKANEAAAVAAGSVVTLDGMQMSAASLIASAAPIITRFSEEKNIAFEGVARLLFEIKALRRVRDQEMFKPEFHTFREWCMSTFGEQLGGWLEEIL